MTFHVSEDNSKKKHTVNETEKKNDQPPPFPPVRLPP